MAMEIRVISPEWEKPLADFFVALRASGERYFHPHPFTDEVAKSLANYRGKDLYYVMVNERKVLAYGMLRGWDEGYDVPSLGIAVHPDIRGKKIGALLMSFLHHAARLSGAQKVRLKVSSENIAARHLYTRLGYSFCSESAGQELLGTLEL